VYLQLQSKLAATFYKALNRNCSRDQYFDIGQSNIFHAY
jgi:hypothetical protein